MHFKDSILENDLLYQVHFIDHNNNKIIELSETSMVTKITLSSKKISSLTGLSHFKNLETIHLFQHQFNTADYNSQAELLELIQKAEPSLYFEPIELFTEDEIPVHPENKIYEFPDIEAQFPGGSIALQKWIISNVKYPNRALENDEQGRVYASFIVNKDGSITNIKIERKVSTLLDNEVTRLISIMPNWVPAETRGKVVRSRCRLPVSFCM